MKRIPLSQGKFAIVDDEDFEYLSRFNWWAAQSPHRKHVWYAVRNALLPDGRRTVVLMHREIMKATTKQRVDHRNGDGLDNQRQNLRFATQRQNSQNRRHKIAGCTSRFKGVYWNSRKKRWYAQIADGSIRLNGKARHRYLGSYITEEAAAEAYARAAKASFGEFAATGVRS